MVRSVVLRRSGSSPLARGLLPHGAAVFVVVRIIPARAGFTPTDGTGEAGIEDHPRSRGVYALVRSVVLRRSGSSPLARGLRLSNATWLKDSRIIPARAGFTAYYRQRP